MKNSETDKLKEQAQKVVDQLMLVKSEFIKNKEELAVSVRKDVVVAELRQLLASNKDYTSLSNELKAYIDNLIQIGG